jgi:hypothetical protein
VAITERQSIWRSAAKAGEVETPFSAGVRRTGDIEAAYDDPLAREPKWAAWKVTVVVVVFCAAFWSGVGYIAMRLLG